MNSTPAAAPEDLHNAAYGHSDSIAPAFEARLRALQFLQADDFRALTSLFGRSRVVEPGTIVVPEGASGACTVIAVEGWGIRYKTVPDGGRQILNFVLPGDITGAFSALFQHSEQGMEAITGMRLLDVPQQRLLDAIHDSPRLAVVLGWLAGQDERELAEQIVRVGRRNSSERMAHLLVELYQRQCRAGAENADAHTLPLTQALLADALGLSHVHAHRQFRLLARKGLIERDGAGVMLLNPRELAPRAGFDAGYLRQVRVPHGVKARIERAGR